MTMTHEEIIDALSRTSARHELIMAVSQAVKERDKARSILATIAAGINPYEDQLQNWIAGQIDTALVGKVEGADT